MADQDQQQSIASTFPNPPPFWKDFTPERIARLDSLRREHAERNGLEESPARIPDLPEELCNLQPPAEPADGKWRVFGDQYTLDDKLPSLGEQGLTDLRATNADSGPVDTVSSATNHYDRALELKRLAKSLLLNFLELVSTLSHAPASAEAKIDDLNTLFMNMHHVLNEYRPHQARESAIELMQTHLDRVRGETAAVRAQVDKARSVLEGLGSLRVEEDEEGGGKTGAGHEEEVRRKAEEGEREKVLVDREAEVWGALDSACA